MDDSKTTNITVARLNTLDKPKKLVMQWSLMDTIDKPKKLVMLLVHVLPYMIQRR